MTLNLFGSRPDFDRFEYLIVGLGNPGLKYSSTRHNLGFMLVDRLLEEYDPESDFTQCNSRCFATEIGEIPVLLAKPQSLMNLSGGPVRCLTDKCDGAELLVVSDDVHLDLGTLRTRDGGSAGGHNGLKDIITKLGTEEFYRLKLGCGPAPSGMDLAEYVLEQFAEDEWPLVGAVLDEAAEFVAQTVKGEFKVQTLHTEAPASS